MMQSGTLLKEGWSFLEGGLFEPPTPCLPWDGAARDADTDGPESPRVMNLINIAGTQYYCGPGYFRGLRAGVPVRLVRENENQHDPNAVAVYIGLRKVGYIPKHSNRAIAGWMDRGAAVAAEVSAVRNHANPWNRVFVRVAVSPQAA